MRVRAVTGIGRYLAAVTSSSGTLICICLTDTRLSAHLVMALYLGAARHSRWGNRKERETVILIRYPSSPQSGMELSGLNGM